MRVKSKKAASNNSLVCAVMLNWNAGEMSVKGARSLLASDYGNLILYLVDNGSPDASWELFEKEFGTDNRVQLLQTGRNMGYARGMNFGLQKAAEISPDYFLIINNDIKIAPESLTELVKTSRRYDDNCLVTGKVYRYFQPDVFENVGGYRDDRTLQVTPLGRDVKDEGQFEEEAEREAIDDMMMLFPRKVYDLIGGYCPYFTMNYEQADLVIRAREKGIKLIYCPRARLWHIGSYATGGVGNPVMMFWDAESKIILHYLHQCKRDFLVFHLGYFLSCLKDLLRRILVRIRDSNYPIKPSWAQMIGFFSGTYWIFNKMSTQSGYNPFLKKK